MIKHHTVVRRVEGTRRNLEVSRDSMERLLISGQEMEGVQEENLGYYLGKVEEVINGLDDIFPECVHFHKDLEKECAYVGKKRPKHSRG